VDHQAKTKIVDHYHISSYTASDNQKFVIMTVKLTTFLLFMLTARRLDRADSQACSFCADGKDEEGFRYFVGDESASTCTELMDQWNQLDALDSDPDCKDLQLYAFQIGCCKNPPYRYCEICPDGSDFKSENRVELGNADNPTCGELEFRAASLVGVFKPGVCEDTFLRRSAIYCGCPNVQQECFLCPGGSEVGNAKREDKWLTMGDCAGNQYLFSTLTAEECNPDLFGIDLAGFCLCPDSPPPSEPVCELCPGGEVENPKFLYDESKTDATCGQLEKFAVFITNTDRCDSLLAPAKEGCKCRNSGSLDKSFVASLVFAGAMAIPAIL
jgi:hypothetical protein